MTEILATPMLTLMVLCHRQAHHIFLFARRALIVIWMNGGAKLFIEEFMFTDMGETIYICAQILPVLVSIQRLPTSGTKQRSLPSCSTFSHFRLSGNNYMWRNDGEIRFEQRVSQNDTRSASVVHTQNQLKYSSRLFRRLGWERATIVSDGNFYSPAHLLESLCASYQQVEITLEGNDYVVDVKCQRGHFQENVICRIENKRFFLAIVRRKGCKLKLYEVPLEWDFTGKYV